MVRLVANSTKRHHRCISDNTHTHTNTLTNTHTRAVCASGMNFHLFRSVPPTVYNI